VQRLLATFKPIPFALGLAAFAALTLLDSPLRHFGEHGALPALAAAVTAWMAIWWIGEAVPLWLTALIPIAVYPLSRVYGDGRVANLAGALAPYLDPYIFLFLGGMGIAAAMQQWNLHRRVALAIMRRVGVEPARLLFGVLAATALVSLWISNTATAAMMLPIGLAVVHELERQAGRRLAGFGCAMMLAIAYGANVGGMGTKIGTVPNAQLAGFLAQERGVDLSFLQFMAIGLPFVLMFLPVVWLALWRVGRADAPPGALGRAALDAETARLGPLQPTERAVAFVFVSAAALWIAGKPLTDWLKPQVAAFELKTRSALVQAAAVGRSRAARRRLLDGRGGRCERALRMDRHADDRAAHTDAVRTDRAREPRHGDALRVRVERRDHGCHASDPREQHRPRAHQRRARLLRVGVVVRLRAARRHPTQRDRVRLGLRDGASHGAQRRAARLARGIDRVHLVLVGGAACARLSRRAGWERA
jgi:hypothetical protein